MKHIIEIEISHGTLDHGHTSLWFTNSTDALAGLAEMDKRGETAFIVAITTDADAAA